MSKTNDTETYAAALRHPFYGVIGRCIGSGSAVARGPTGEVLIRLRDHLGRHLDTMEGLEKRSCIYSVVEPPKNRSQGNRESSVVPWRLLDDFDPPLTPKAFKKARGKALLALDKDQLYSFLSAEWYVRLCRGITGENPKSILRADNFLDQLLEIRLKEVNDVEELIRLLAAIFGSCLTSAPMEQTSWIA